MRRYPTPGRAGPPSASDKTTIHVTQHAPLRNGEPPKPSSSPCRGGSPGHPTTFFPSTHPNSPLKLQMQPLDSPSLLRPHFATGLASKSLTAKRGDFSVRMVARTGRGTSSPARREGVAVFVSDSLSRESRQPHTPQRSPMGRGRPIARWCGQSGCARPCGGSIPRFPARHGRGRWETCRGWISTGWCPPTPGHPAREVLSESASPLRPCGWAWGSLRRRPLSVLRGRCWLRPGLHAARRAHRPRRGTQDPWLNPACRRLRDASPPIGPTTTGGRSAG